MASSEGFIETKLLLWIFRLISVFQTLLWEKTCHSSFIRILWILPLLLRCSVFSDQSICHISCPAAWSGHSPYMPAHMESQFLCHLCTWSFSFRHLSPFSVVQFPASVVFCCSTNRGNCIFFWISGMRRIKKLLGREPRKKIILVPPGEEGLTVKISHGMLGVIEQRCQDEMRTLLSKWL